MVLLAIKDQPLANVSFQKGLSWLLASQNQDGGWGINAEDSESGWQTAWALIALRNTTRDNPAVARAIEWMMTVATAEVSRDEFLKDVVPQNNNIGALAWPWLAGQVSWIEPTALAVLALAGITSHPLALARIKAAADYFKRYRTPSGGWNVGNAGPLDTIVIPRAYPTALVLLALASISPGSVDPSDLTALQQDLARDPSVLAHAAGMFALRMHGINTDASIKQLTDRQLSDGSWDHNPFFTAWSMLSIRGSW